MPSLVLKPTHKPVKNYYAALQQLAAQGATHEGAVKTAFLGLLEACASQRQWTLLGEYEIRRPGQHPLRVDAALRDNFWITHGYWEAKDTDDDLEQEARKKFAAGYPQDNILFQSPDRALLFQDRQLVLDADLTHPDRLVAALNAFFAYTKPAIEEWDKAVAEFQQRVPELGKSLTQIVEDERQTNKKFITAFEDFCSLCRGSWKMVLNFTRSRDPTYNFSIQCLH